jgi:hypothetical protein
MADHRESLLVGRHRHLWEVCDDPLCCAGEKEWCEGCSGVRYHSRLKRLGLRFPFWNIRQLVRHGEWR